VDNVVEFQEQLTKFGGAMVIYLPVLFGAVEFIKNKLGIKGRTVEFLSVGLFVLFGVLVVAAYYYPERGVQAGSIVLFLLMCALAPSGYYKFINTRTERNQ
jgi:hypothetical protein